MKYTLFLAVNIYKEYMYLDETPLAPIKPNQSRLLDLIDDMNALENELNWGNIDKEYVPENVGMYQAMVQFVQTAEDDYRLDVIHCTPICITFDKKGESTDE